ncbi:MAG: helix-turn-helix transcriptional regulator [Lachnospiraceae bacterium]|nr:helix-turn-helix transcriptional regulator [Lachnospiraceae bacterium]
MYRLLEARLVYKGISKKQLAEGIHMSYGTILSKMTGRSKFTLDEAIRIKEYLEEEISVEELFEEV